MFHPNQDLIDVLKSELGGSLENVVLELLMTDAERDASTLRKAMKVCLCFVFFFFCCCFHFSFPPFFYTLISTPQGAGTDDEMLIEILASRSDSEINQIKATYKTKFGRDLEKDIKSETSGSYERLLVGLVQVSFFGGEKLVE